MDSLLVSRIIHAAQTGRLTEEQYALYIKLLEKDPDFQSLVEWEEFLDRYLPVALETEKVQQQTPAPKPHIVPVKKRLSYGAAASLALILLGGWLWYNFWASSGQKPVLMAHSSLRLYSDQSLPKDQLGYADGVLPIAMVNISFWHNKNQLGRLSYQFCNDTLKFYFKQSADTTNFVNRSRLMYSYASKQYYLTVPEKSLHKLQVCLDKPQILLK